MSKQDKQTKETEGTKKKKIPLLFVILVLVLLTAIAVLGALYVIAVHYYAAYQLSMPISYADLRPDQYVTYIYDYSGTQIDSLHGVENREYALFSEIPVDLRNAVIAIEDQRFYSHPGVDLKSVARAVYVNLRERAFVEGASTITQQLVKNNLLKDTSKRFSRKIEEQCVAFKLENELTAKLGTKEAAKDYILEQYLNSVNLAHGFNGVKLAAKYYFGKNLGDLTLTECASIAAIIKNPVKYSPSSPESNWERTKIVLNKMLEQEMISYMEYAYALEQDIYALNEHILDDAEAVIHSYFVDQVINEIVRDLMYEKGLDEKSAYKLVYSGGLKIYTTFDSEIQAIIDESFNDDSLFPKSGSVINVNIMFETEQGIVRKNGTVESEAAADAFVISQRQYLRDAGYSIENESVQKIIEPQGAFVILDFKTGHVPAIGAGRGEKKYNLAFNRATQAKRQPGSCFKVLAAYLPALDTGTLAASSLITDEPFTVDDYSPNNYDFAYRGNISVRTAIRDSINVAAVKTLVGVGYEKAFEYLKKLGFTTLVEGRTSESGKVYTDLGPALALGGITDGVTPLELAAAFGAIANEGKYLRPVFYTKVLAHDGTVLLENTVEPLEAMKPETSFILTDMMVDVVEGGTGKLAQFEELNVPISGKTGTSTDDRDLSFGGFTPFYAAAVWQGYDMPMELNYDKSYHLLLWSEIMERVHFLKGYTSGSFDIPEYMTDEDLGRNVKPPAKPQIIRRPAAIVPVIPSAPPPEEEPEAPAAELQPESAEESGEAVPETPLPDYSQDNLNESDMGDSNTNLDEQPPDWLNFENQEINAEQ